MGKTPKIPPTTAVRVDAQYMADETTTEEETTTPEAETEEVETEETVEAEAESEEESDESEETEPVIDWKKVAEDEATARKKAEAKLAGERFKNKHKRTEDGEDSEEDDEEEDRPLTAKELDKILAKEREATRRELQSGAIKEEAKALAESEDEAAAIIAIHSNRQFPEGMPLKDQIREAYFIAHGPRILAKTAELRRALKAKNTVKTKSNENTHRQESVQGEPKLAPQDKTELSRVGFKWDGKRYSKPLSNGKVLVRDLKTKKTFVTSA